MRFRYTKPRERREDLTISVVTKHYTDKAALFERRDGSEVWVPLSAIVGDDAPARGERGDVTVAGWLADERGMEPDELEVIDDNLPHPGGTVFSCGRDAGRPRRRVSSPAFGDGLLVEERGDRVVADFPAPHGRKTVLRSKVTLA